MPQRRRRCRSPLPLPATPLRRSEKKREPSPPALVGSVTFSEPAGWETTIIDIEKWVDFTNCQLGQRYRFVGTDFGKFSYDPAELPILYFTGLEDRCRILTTRRSRSFASYLMDGGTWVVHSNCGRPEFNKSFREEIQPDFPRSGDGGRPHRSSAVPVFYKITQMRVRKGSEPWQTISTADLEDDQHRHPRRRRHLLADRSVLRLGRQRQSHRGRACCTTKPTR